MLNDGECRLCSEYNKNKDQLKSKMSDSRKYSRPESQNSKSSRTFGGGGGLRILFRDGEVIDQPMGLSPTANVDNRDDLSSDGESATRDATVAVKAAPPHRVNKRSVVPAPDILHPGVDLNDSRPSIPGRSARDTNTSQMAMTVGAHPVPIGRTVIGGRRVYERCEVLDCNQAAEFVCNDRVESVCQAVFCCDREGFRGCKKKVCVSHVMETKED